MSLQADDARIDEVEERAGYRAGQLLVRELPQYEIDRSVRVVVSYSLTVLGMRLAAFCRGELSTWACQNACGASSGR
ncbi:MAG: hypothetical protein OEM67_09455 [Thermoleophilia bacterium]|nr:hypothetical protein [Thermoleophilia bacterium]